jgi:hypothetical protein
MSSGVISLHSATRARNPAMCPTMGRGAVATAPAPAAAAAAAVADDAFILEEDVFLNDDGLLLLSLVAGR